MRAKPALVALTLAAIWGCTDQPGPTSSSVLASRSGLPFAEGLASPTWQALSAGRVAAANFSPLQGARAYGLVGVAQYLAVQRADVAVGGNGRSQLEAERGAVAGASAVVLTYLFPTASQTFEDLVAAQ